MKKISTIILTLSISTIMTLQTYSQDISDALRYSNVTHGGTARFMSMGGSFGALGGDFSSLSTNPAGIGVYRSSEISFTPSLYYNEIESSYYNKIMDDFEYNFTVHNLGGILSFETYESEDTPGWRRFNLGIGINRHNNFNFRRVTEGVNPDNSLLTEWRDQVLADGYYNDYRSRLAYETYLIDYIDADNGDDLLVTQAPDGGLLTKQESSTKGYIRDLELSLGANYNDQLYIGASFGFPRVNYENNTTHTESDGFDNYYVTDSLNSFSYTHNLKTTGSGFNLKFGAIYRASDMIRIGVAVHTPTFYDLTDEFNTEVESDIEHIEEEERHIYFAESTQGKFDYELNTPVKAITSLGLIFGAKGMINIEYEYVNHANARLRSNDYRFSSENNIISTDLRAQHKIRAGGEAVFKPFALRSGFAYYSNPYEEGENDRSQYVISAGFGIREKHYFLDLAYVLSLYSEDYYPYGEIYTKPIENKYTENAFVVTLGLKF